MTYGSSTTPLYKLIATNCSVQGLFNERDDATDGALFVPATLCADITTSTAAAITRNAEGDYSLKCTAGGAETHYFVGSMSLPVRSTASKGVKLTSVKAIYTLGVADATSVDMVVKQATYADRVAHVIANHGGTLTYDTNHDTAAERKEGTDAAVNPHVLTVTCGTPAFQTSGLVTVTAELAVVLANTGTFELHGFAFFYTYDNL